MEGIKFLKFPTKRYIRIFIELFLYLFYILQLRPDVIFLSGASRGLSYLSFFSKITKTKLVFLSASNTDFQKGDELRKAEHDKKLFRYGLKKVIYFIVQNRFQQEQLQLNYNKKNSIIIPNIWVPVSVLYYIMKK